MSVVARPAVADQYKPWTIAQIARTKESCVQVVYKCRFSVLGDLAEIAHLAIHKRQPNAIPTTEGLTSIGVSERVTPARGCHSVVMNPYVPNYCDGVHPGASSGSGRIVIVKTPSEIRTNSAQRRSKRRTACDDRVLVRCACARARACACGILKLGKLGKFQSDRLAQPSSPPLGEKKENAGTVAVPRGALGRVEAGICARRASDGSCSI